MLMSLWRTSKNTCDVMAYFLDTHTLIWFVSGDNQLPESSKEVIKNLNESCFLSAASLWEVSIKHQIKKLELGISLEELFEFVGRNQIENIPINSFHFLQLSKLPFYQYDPVTDRSYSTANHRKFTVDLKRLHFKGGYS